ncbi:MAG TPA: hypothetical protein VE570_08660 [Thermoleophilaceae bacterium]|jgi:uncharacterized membrane protein|nr:hypothetical protein [Thermoleophilaceae bacterium]
MILASLVDWGTLGDVVLYSFIGAVGLTTVLSVGIVGLARYDDRRRSGRGGRGAAYAALAVVCSVVLVAVVVEAIVVMAKK